MTKQEKKLVKVFFTIGLIGWAITIIVVVIAFHEFSQIAILLK